jgi:GMP synthase (glutamine-hydrolysing)
MKIHYLQHVDFEGLSTIGEWANERGFQVAGTQFYDINYQLPAIEDVDLLIILGGPMSVNDNQTYPWLELERAMIRQAIEAGKHVLGICLGAQQIAKALGADVRPGTQQEIGWYPIAFLDNVAGHPLLGGLNTAMTVFHWHGETFDIPIGAMRLARSVACANQGFLYRDKVLALQCHMEMSEATVNNMVKACKQVLVEGEFIQSEQAILSGAERYCLKNNLCQLLDNWMSL